MLTSPPYKNQPARPADMDGAGAAWRVTAPEAPEWQQAASCGAWLIHAPHGNPMWPWYFVTVINLRNHDGQTQPPHVQYPGASHEFIVLALAPDKPLPDPDRWGADGTPRPVTLEPVDQVVQFIVADDAQATALLENAVQAILAGMSPDQDYRQWWRSAIAQTAEHYRLGGHPDDEAGR